MSITKYATTISLALLAPLYHPAINAAERQEISVNYFTSNLSVQNECLSRYAEQRNREVYLYVSGDCDEFGRPNGYAEGRYVYGSAGGDKNKLTLEGPFINGTPANNGKFTVRFNHESKDSQINYTCENIDANAIIKGQLSFKTKTSRENITCKINGKSLLKWESDKKYEATITGKLQIGDNPCHDCIVLTDARIVRLIAEKTPLLYSDSAKLGPASPFGSKGSLYQYKEASKYINIKDAFTRKISIFKTISVDEFTGKVIAILNNSNEPLVFHEDTRNERGAIKIIENERGEKLQLTQSSKYDEYGPIAVVGFRLPDGTTLEEAKGFSAGKNGFNLSSYADVFTDKAYYQDKGYQGPIYSFGGIYLAPKFGQLTLPNGEIKNGYFGTWEN